MTQERTVLVVGKPYEVAPIVDALAPFVRVTACDLKRRFGYGWCADLEIICYDPSQLIKPEGLEDFPSDENLPGNDPQELRQLMALVRQPVPVLFVHECPTIWDVNYLRSMGAAYVLDRRIENQVGWRGLIECVRRMLEEQPLCVFCNRPSENGGPGLRGVGGVVVCRNCILMCARDLLWSGGAEGLSTI